jgi:penicillin-binding protein 1C
MREVTGLTGAAPIWHRFMRTVLAGSAPRSFVQPDGFVRVEVCSLSGALPGVCPYRRSEWFIDGTQPTQTDGYYREVVLDGATGALANSSTPASQRINQVILDLPPSLGPWARQEGLELYSNLVPEAVPGQESSLRLVSPPDRSVYRLAGSWQVEAQRLRIEATGQAGLKSVALWLDGEPIATLERAPYAAFWQLQPGQHQAWAEAILEDGSRITSPPISFTVTE